MNENLVIAPAAFSFGIFCYFLLDWIRKRQIGQQLRLKAQSIINLANENSNFSKEKRDVQIQSYRTQAYKRFEKEKKKVEQKRNQLNRKLEEQEKNLKLKLSAQEKTLDKHKEITGQFEAEIKSAQNKINSRKEVGQALSDQYIRSLLTTTESERDQVVEILKEELLEKARLEVNRNFFDEEEFKTDSERVARRILEKSLSRFSRPYCAERGIGFINFPNQRIKNKVLGPDHKFLSIIEKICGLDMFYDTKNNSISISGFDPVRRELGRALFQNLMKERHVDPERIPLVYKKTKNSLLKTVTQNGRRVINELNIRGLHPEIVNTMGTLMYRYSFAQNQYYHCSEVGFLCGLLASELELAVPTARRAGLLHDIGKAMDHSLDGGHAVIGADFIEKRDEDETIVHAVRAHHFDITPSTDLAYLVIAADAISGARPGARRSTANSYMQKMEDLQVIANGFDNVTDSLILNAGREVRVIVNGKTTDDNNALKLSKDIAQKIEAECIYPGTVKVTVVRQSQAIEYAK